MPGPTAALTTLRPDLGGSFLEFDLAMQASGFIGAQALPVITSAKQTGPFGKIPVEQLLQSPDTSRAPGSGYSRGHFTFSTDTFATEEHGWEEPVDDREAQMYSDYFDAEQIATARAMGFVLRAAEERAASLLFNASTWTPTAVTNEWDDYANATPVQDVEAAVQRVYAASGLWANTLIVSRKVFRNLRMTDEVRNRISSSGAGSPSRASDVTVDMLATVFDLPKILVGGGTKNTANPGAAATLDGIWDDEYAMVAKTADTSDIREPCVGRIIHWQEDGSEIDGRVETYRDETIRSDVVRVRHDVDEKVLYTEAAGLLSNITA